MYNINQTNLLDHKILYEQKLVKAFVLNKSGFGFTAISKIFNLFLLKSVDGLKKQAFLIYFNNSFFIKRRQAFSHLLFKSLTTLILSIFLFTNVINLITIPTPIIVKLLTAGGKSLPHHLRWWVINPKGSNVLSSNNGSITLQANANTIPTPLIRGEVSEADRGVSSPDNKSTNNSQSKGNINIKGSNIASETGTNLFAENDINIITSIDAERHYTKTEKDNDLTGGSIDIKDNIKNTNNSTNITSNNGNLNIIAGRNVNSVTSNLATNETGDINLLAGYTTQIDPTTGQINLTQKTDKDGNITGGNVNLLSTQDLEKNYTYHEEWGGVLDMIANFDIDLDKSGLTISTSYEESLDENTTLTNTARVNNLQANNGNININATENILSVGSQIYADNNINLNAGWTDKDGNKHSGNILLTSANNNQTTDSKHEETTVTVGVKVGNSFVDAGYAVDAVVKAGEEVKSAKDEVKRMKDLRDENKASDEAVKDAELNLAMASVNLANATLGMMTAMGSAAGSSATAGFYGSAFANYDTMESKSSEQSNWQTQGNIQTGNGNINFNTTNDMLQEGTNLYATNNNNQNTGTINYNIGNDLTILASKDTYTAQTNSENKNVNATVGTNGFSIGVGGGNASSKTNSTTYNNSEVLANNINIKTGNNAIISGANITAEKGENNTGGNLTADIGNNLTVESLQDTLYSKSNSNSANFGIGNSSISGGYSKEKSYTDSAWVNNQTSLIVDNEINIKVGTKENSEGKTDIKGAVINSNSDNLILETKDLAYNDIKDTYYTETKGSNFSTTVGTDPDKGKANTAPMGSATLGLTSTGSEREQETRATIGNGSIVIAGKEVKQEIITTLDENGNTITKIVSDNTDLIRGLNRDKDKSQQITKDMIIGALDGSMTVDNRLLFGFIDQNVYERDKDGKVKKDENGKAIVMKDKNGNNVTTNGYKSIGSDVKNFGKNTKISLDFVSDVVGAVPGSPIWASRKLTEETGIPPHLLPSLWIGDEVMGQATIRRDENNKPIARDVNGNKIIYQETDNKGFKSDNNLLFKFLYAVVPGGKASTDQHDILMNKYGINSNLGLGATIAPSFAATYYGAVGTILDTKNYGSNASKIKDSYDNSVPNGSVIINNQTGNIKVKFNPDPKFDYKGINIIRGR